MTVLVTGATGTTGSRVAALLDDAGADVRRAARSTPVRFDWADPATHDAAFDGVDRLYLLPPLATPDPAPVVAPVLERAVGRGLRRVVLLSAAAVERGTPGLGAVQDLVAETVPEPVLLRPSWFTQNLLGDHLAARGLRSGELVTATGDGRLPFVDAGDIAAVAAALLLADGPPEPDVVVTGPEPLSYDDVCAVWTDVTGTPARHVAVSVAAMTDRLVADGMPADYAAVLAGLDGLIATGAQSGTSDAVRRWTGREPRSVREVLAAAVAGSH
ncbi:oxidoreductase [Pseudonocardia sp. EC080610-09]|uniref:NAD(P)-dependent oxidoreductase n=1 Tax=unclassified Pseudonocardia TaxID=2619320 RepID=UPI0006CB2DEA|nr:MULTISPECIES: NAD(P)-dependent oxidoreductase [unclassified Pseudonocardia]ALE75295.1 oxidoreductase [Pseudonocardia sp. EC080625-04]ALL74659.1 oxidoreductase [Pseudonocardia sp. EC080610-09]ALL81681.1 oxidoreductase [Pseudonocardia sp. EC080619-01]